MTQRAWPLNVSPGNYLDTIQQMLGTRQEDIVDYEGLPNRFIGGRLVRKIPTSSADYDVVNDHVGDFSYDLSYMYILVQDGDSAAWRRVALGAF